MGHTLHRLSFALGLGTVFATILTASSRGSSWLTDAPGYSEARRQHVGFNKPLVIYFYVDWCPYCRGLENEILNTSQVEGFLSGFPRVKVNPEHGANEEALAKQFGVHGYPNFLIIPMPGGTPRKISGWTRSGDQWVRAKPGEFLAECREALETEGPRATRDAQPGPSIQPSMIEAPREDGKYYRGLGERQYRSGKKAAALQAFEKCLELDPGDTVALDWAAYISIEVGRYRGALGYANRLTELAPGYGKGRAYYLRGYAHSELGNSLKARQDAQKACDSGYAEGCTLLRELE